MKMHNLFIAVVILSMGACAREEVIPERLTGNVNRDFDLVKARHNPEAYLGTLVLVRGEVLSATRREEGTRMEVLHRPLSSDLVPREDRKSDGRFVAIDQERQVIDPALLQEHRLVTIVGEVVGMDTVKIDGISKTVPQLRVKQVTLWEWKRGYPDYGHYAPYAWGSNGYYAYPQRK